MGKYNIGHLTFQGETIHWTVNQRNSQSGVTYDPYPSRVVFHPELDRDGGYAVWKDNVDDNRTKGEELDIGSIVKGMKGSDELFSLFKYACKEARFADDLGHPETSPINDKFCRYLVLALARDLNPNLSGKWNETLLHIAAKYGREDAMEILSKRGANTQAKMFLSGKTPEDYLKSYHKEQDKKATHNTKSSTIRGRVACHSTDNAQTVLNRTGGKGSRT